ncbi:hypothetical protein E2C01_054981 [Portunus trituberculatus]|uniref:Uncharacterized protein n=1 Tax=Portunus trituberculatus TaxID=210409 RepID=A0A5B7GL87_PORTR|nr:hypothetical protein [Portunus trituberculatus]
MDGQFSAIMTLSNGSLDPPFPLLLLPYHDPSSSAPPLCSHHAAPPAPSITTTNISKSNLSTPPSPPHPQHLPTSLTLFLLLLLLFPYAITTQLPRCSFITSTSAAHAHNASTIPH